MRKIIPIVTLIIVLVALSAWFLFSYGWLRFNHPAKDEFPIVGIDISHHQGRIDWKELESEKINFVFIKATEGIDYTDSLFKKNWNNSMKYGYKTGAYHFYRLCKGGKEQALHFIDIVPNHINTLPPAIDLEFGGNCNSDKSKRQILQEVRECLAILQQHYKKPPIIYATKEFYNEYLINELPEYHIWIRDIFRRPRLSDGKEWTIWQFANRAHLHGIDTYVDLNVLNGKTFDVLK